MGYRLVDPRTKGRLVFLPDTAGLSGVVLEKLKNCDALLLDGTFWDDDEMKKSGAGTLTATQMAHLPVGGPQGSLEIIRKLTIRRKIYMHINNTNPMLDENSPQHKKIKDAGAEVGIDGVEFEI